MIALVATVIHEVPHEFSDFALLLRDGYSRKKAICFQVNIIFPEFSLKMFLSLYICILIVNYCNGWYFWCHFVLFINIK